MACNLIGVCVCTFWSFPKSLNCFIYCYIYCGPVLEACLPSVGMSQRFTAPTILLPVSPTNSQSFDKSNKWGCLFITSAMYVPEQFNNGMCECVKCWMCKSPTIDGCCRVPPHHMCVSFVHTYIELKSCSRSISGNWFVWSALEDAPDSTFHFCYSYHLTFSLNQSYQMMPFSWTTSPDGKGDPL